MSFENYLKNLKFKPKTIERYLAWEKEFLLFFSTESKDINKLNYNDLIKYFNKKEEANLKRSSLLLILGRIQQYYDYLEQENPFADFKLKGCEPSKKLPILSPSQLQQISTCYHQNARLSLESKIIIDLMIYQAVAANELPLLKVEHIDLQRAEIAIPPSRLNTRTIALQASQILNLLNFIQDKKATENLLNYKGSSHLQNRHFHWKEQIKRELKKQKMAIPFCNLHQLRAGRIALWVKDLGILHAQYLAGHQLLSSTQYYQTEDHEQLRATFTQIHPFF